MAKHLPTDALIMLHNRLATLKPRDSNRRLIITEAAQFYGISTAKLYRELRQHNKPKAAYRTDYNHPRLTTFDEMRRYCELIAALKLRTTNKKGRHLSTKECIRLLENHGVKTPEGLVKVPTGFLKKSTVSVYLQRFGLDPSSLTIQPTVVRFQAEQSNACWHFDFSHSDFKHFPDDQKKSRTEHSPTLMIASVVDDRSGVTYQEYHYVYGEDVTTALKFLYHAMATKKISHFPFQGIPGMLYLDNGPVAKSTTFQRAMASLGVEVKTHLPDGHDGRRKTARSKGKVERPFRTVKETLEPLYHLQAPQNLTEANHWLHQYLQRYNQEKHRYESHSRLEDWKLHLPPEGFREMCDWDRFTAICREPESRKVGSDACVIVNTVPYQLSNELAGLTVTLLWGLFDNELHVEYDGQQYGPFYPAKGPIPLGQYRSFKKSSREKRADYIGELAKKISLPSTVLGTQDKTTEQLLSAAGLAQEKLSCVPFNSLETNTGKLFKNTIEAKAAIARWLGFPLGQLQPEQMTQIDAIVTATLEKQVVMSRIKQLFELRLIVPQQEER